MKDLDDLKYFLGIEVSKYSTGFHLSQCKYALDIIAKTEMLGANPVSFPLEQNHKLSLSISTKFADSEQCRRLVGRLIYLAATCPDLAYSVHVLAKYMQKPH